MRPASVTILMVGFSACSMVKMIRFSFCCSIHCNFVRSTLEHRLSLVVAHIPVLRKKTHVVRLPGKCCAPITEEAEVDLCANIEGDDVCEFFACTFRQSYETQVSRTFVEIGIDFF